ncbi:hypothetical protein D7003_02690 [Arthrobacter oryzae]|uniref:Uncharacterized protein n=1 Tax=Arthrobacter oryzae TaxID=409290 RepID=A0A3N0C8E0_9MICC|nr:hypothetical protein D7003_02690 [Arthrobacter oryzae]
MFVKAAVVGRMPARITNMPLRTTIKTTWTREAIRPINPRTMRMNTPIPVWPDTTRRLIASAKPLPSVDRSMMAAEKASAAMTRMEMTPKPRPETKASVMRDRRRSFSGAPRCSQIIRMPPRMTARTASDRVQSINSLFTTETTGLGVAPSELARFTVGMDTQKVDRVVTI